MKGGHNKKSTSELKLAGTYRADRHETRLETKVGPLQSVPKPPKDFDKTHRVLWTEFCKQAVALNVLTEYDLQAVRMWCETYVLRARALADVNENGVTVWVMSTQGDNVPKKNPANDLIVQYSGILMRIQEQFGFTPKSRQGIHLKNKPTTEEKADPRENLFSGANEKVRALHALREKRTNSGL